MEEKIIELLERIDQRLKSIDESLKNNHTYSQASYSQAVYQTKETEKPQSIKTENKQPDVLHEWEKQMPYDEMLKKLYPKYNK